MSIVINDDNFEEVLKSDKIIFIDCYADWCGPCKYVKPMLEEIEKENNDIQVGLVNIEESTEISSTLKVTSIPKVVVFYKGVKITEIIGVSSKEKYQEVINSIKEK